ncbi:MAG TPA: TrkA family potassium uptake protein [Jatrophihabitantaceae bacterium]
MHIVIMGCGRVGSTLAHELERREHSVAVIDMNPDAFRRLGEHFRGRQITGLGFDRDTLVAADIEQADAFAAVSYGDNSNIISARLARETFGVQKVIARIYDPKRAEVYERLGIPTVATVPWTANRLLKAVLGEATDEVWRDPSGAVALVHVSPHEGWIGHLLTDFEAATGSRVALVTRFGIGELPTSSTMVQDGDALHVLVNDAHAPVLRDVAERAPEGAHA